ncbi:MAG TPA: TatD family hydrolase [Gemmataceae bacterium]|nr:TatD family hydrolase [Gemmataceae bacterium]
MTNDLNLIDTHAHLDDEKFRDDLPAVLERAAAAGVIRIITIATTAASSSQSIQLARRYPLLAATAGIQPNHVAQENPTAWDEVVSLVEKNRVAALGETGLDRYWDYTPFAQQEEFFARHLNLARRRNLPVVIHCRESETDMLRMLREDYERHGPVRGVMHSFTGTPATAQACLAMGLYISFAGMITYKNAQNLRAAAEGIPRDRMVVETDSPYLAPVPVRGQRNEPAFVAHTLTFLANYLRMDAPALATQTTLNAKSLFGFE